MIQNEKHLLVMYKERIRNFMPKRALEDVAILVGRRGSSVKVQTGASGKGGSPSHCDPPGVGL